MSFLKTKILASIFILFALVVQPYAAFAQINWTPPDGPPLSNNTPAPVNVGPIDQAKTGAIFVTKQPGSTGLAVPFSNSMFGFYSSQLGSYPTDVSIYGNLIYRYPGQIIPPFGTVLSPDTNGVAKWVNIRDILGPDSYDLSIQEDGTEIINRPGVINFVENGDAGLLDVVQSSPDSVDVIINSDILSTLGGNIQTGNNTGDILFWNDVTLQWQSTNLNLNNGDILVWNSTTNQWENVNITNVTGGLPPGTDGQTLVNSNGTWIATDKIKHPTAMQDTNFDGLPDGYLTQITNDIVNVNAKQFNVDGVSGQGRIQLKSPELFFLSPNVYFRNINNNQEVVFESANIKIKGPQNNNQLDPGEHSLLFATDDEGSVKWSKGAFYWPDFFLPGVNVLGTRDNPNDDADVPIFVSQGLTFLQGDTTIDGVTTVNNNLTISSDGDLWLQGIEMATEGDNLKHLCVRMTDKKVVRCDFPSNDPDPTETVIRTGTRTETFGPGSETSITFPRPDQAVGPVTVQMCSAGGGGGGGGRGWENGEGDGYEAGHGGGAGGGGGKGECSSTTLNPSNGQTMSWTIGAGGNGGLAGQLDNLFDGNPPQVITDTTATAGQPGGDTVVTFNGNQIANLQGGQGGYAGANATSSGPGVGGSGGSDNINIATASWHRGGNGEISTDNGSIGMGDGGVGGRGEDNAANQGGLGGVMGEAISGSQFGGHGGQGAPSYGGGGGGGGSGKNYDVGDQQIQNRGGWGGRGGDGYVKLTYYVYVEEIVPPTEMVYDTPGTHSFDTNLIPADVNNVTIEVWGAGAGGKATTVATQGNKTFGAGGGAGGYGKQIVDRDTLTGTINVVVGAGGAGGVTGTNSGNGGNGGTSSFGGNISASGGLASTGTAGGVGGSNIQATNQTNGGNGGVGGSFPITNVPAGAGAGGVQSIDGYGNGGNGGSLQWPISTPTSGQPGDDGRVKIDW